MNIGCPCLIQVFVSRPNGEKFSTVLCSKSPEMPEWAICFSRPNFFGFLEILIWIPWKSLTKLSINYILEKLKPLALNPGIGIWMRKSVHTKLYIQGLGQPMMVLLLLSPLSVRLEILWELLLTINIHFLMQVNLTQNL